MSTTVRSHALRALAALALLTLATCGGDDGPSGSSPGDGGSSDGGSSDGGMDASIDGGRACAVREVGCPCSAVQSCRSGECVGGTCVECTRGAEDCACRSNGSCNGALRCVGSTCEACQAGTEDCRCEPNGGCEGDLVCMQDVCAQPGCEPGAEDCPCRSSNPRCDGSGVCDSNDVCRACSTDMPGCPCDGSGACSGGPVCEDDICREAVTCDDFVDDGDCLQHQTCNESSGQDATCVAESCDDGYRWVAGFGCMECPGQNCDTIPTCSGANSIADQCAAAFKECDDSGDMAVCGACLPDTIQNGDNCVPEILCGSAACNDDEYCDTDDDTCKPAACPQGEAQDSGGDCRSCGQGFSCTAAGLTGRTWSFRTADDSCICETAPGYYMPPGGSSEPVRCDADADGWVREEADDQAIRSSGALRLNARCEIRSVDSVRLVDEYGLALEVGSCTEGLIKAPDSVNCTGRVNLRLLETQRNDVPGSPDAANGAPEYGARLLEAEELTSLTKFCVDLLGDFNHDGQEDITEVQESAVDIGTTTDDQRRLRSFSFFGELYRGYYQAGSGAVGTLVIAERSRCDPTTFALAYDSAEGEYDRDQPQTYWRSCARNRAPGYDEAAAKTNTDFAHWSCNATTGTCPTVGPAHPTLTSGLDPSTTLLRDHGLCELNGLTPADNVWRGMGHHSQFKCVQVTNDASPAPHDRLNPTAFDSGSGTYAFNLCGAQGTREVTAGSDEKEPVLDCAVDDPSDGTPLTVGFAALRYRRYGSTTASQGSCTVTCAPLTQYCDPTVNQCKWILTNPTSAIPPTYQGGCVNETAEYGGIACPYPDYSRFDETDAFGRYSCYGDAPNCLWGDAGGRSVLVLADTAATSTPNFCDNPDGKMNPCQCWR